MHNEKHICGFVYSIATAATAVFVAAVVVAMSRRTFEQNKFQSNLK